MELRNQRRLKYFVFILCGVFVTAVVLVVRSSGFQIAYHKWQMNRAWDAAFSEPDADDKVFESYTLGDDYEQYVFHRQQLVNLGGVRELHYRLKHIKVPTDDSHLFTKLLLSPNHPPCIDFRSPYPDDPEPMELTVWCYSENASSWDEFVAAHDVADYQTRFAVSPNE